MHCNVLSMKSGVSICFMNFFCFFTRCIPFALGFLLATTVPVQAQTPGPTTETTAGSTTSAVVFIYHRFGEDSLPLTNIRVSQFEAHLTELSSGGYHVLPVPEILSALQEGRALPERTVGITIDDGFYSVYTEAFPRLREAGFPFTVFIATDSVDSGSENFMNWDQVRELATHGVTIGAHTASHLYMVNVSTSENREEIARSNVRFREELGFIPELFAYPFGESGQRVSALVKDAGYEAAFGQHSGAIYSGSDFFNLPRFAMNEKYGGIGRFRLVANALSLPVSDQLPTDMVLATGNPLVGFTVDEKIQRLDRLACFSSAGSKTTVENLGGRRIEVRFAEQLPLGRSRLNCTLPGPDGRWRWLGIMFLRRPPPEIDE